MGKKNNQTLVSDADQEILHLRSMNNAGNSVNLVFHVIHLPSGWDFCCDLHRKPMLDSIYSPLDDSKYLNKSCVSLLKDEFSLAK